MGIARKFSVAIAATLLSAAPVAAAPQPEPLIVTRLPDPDPGFVPTREPNLVVTRSHGDPDENSIEGAMASFGRSVGQLLQVERQAIEAQCQSTSPASGNATDRFAWAANCAYQRR